MDKKQYCPRCKAHIELIGAVVIDKYMRGSCKKCGKVIIVLAQSNKESGPSYNSDHKF